MPRECRMPPISLFIDVQKRKACTGDTVHPKHGAITHNIEMYQNYPYEFNQLGATSAVVEFHFL